MSFNVMPQIEGHNRLIGGITRCDSGVEPCRELLEQLWGSGTVTSVFGVDDDQLGAGFRSNFGGDKPNKCIHCQVEVPLQWLACRACNKCNLSLPKEPKLCTVCLVRVEGQTRSLQDPLEFLRILNTSEKGRELVEK